MPTINRSASLSRITDLTFELHDALEQAINEETVPTLSLDATLAMAIGSLLHLQYELDYREQALPEIWIAA